MSLQLQLVEERALLAFLANVERDPGRDALALAPADPGQADPGAAEVDLRPHRTVALGDLGRDRTGELIRRHGHEAPDVRRLRRQRDVQLLLADRLRPERLGEGEPRRNAVDAPLQIAADQTRRQRDETVQLGQVVRADGIGDREVVDHEHGGVAAQNPFRRLILFEMEAGAEAYLAVAAGHRQRASGTFDDRHRLHVCDADDVGKWSGEFERQVAVGLVAALRLSSHVEGELGRQHRDVGKAVDRRRVDLNVGAAVDGAQAPRDLRGERQVAERLRGRAGEAAVDREAQGTDRPVRRDVALLGRRDFDRSGLDPSGLGDVLHHPVACLGTGERRPQAFYRRAGKTRAGQGKRDIRPVREANGTSTRQPLLARRIIEAFENQLPRSEIAAAAKRQDPARLSGEQRLPSQRESRAGRILDVDRAACLDAWTFRPMKIERFDRDFPIAIAARQGKPDLGLSDLDEPAQVQATGIARGFSRRCQLDGRERRVRVAEARSGGKDGFTGFAVFALERSLHCPVALESAAASGEAIEPVILSQRQREGRRSEGRAVHAPVRSEKLDAERFKALGEAEKRVVGAVERRREVALRRAEAAHSLLQFHLVHDESADREGLDHAAAEQDVADVDVGVDPLGGQEGGPSAVPHEGHILHDHGDAVLVEPDALVPDARLEVPRQKRVDRRARLVA